MNRNTYESSSDESLIMVLDRGTSVVEPSPLPLLRATRDRQSTSDENPIDLDDDSDGGLSSEAEPNDFDMGNGEGLDNVNREHLYRLLSQPLVDRYSNQPKCPKYKTGRGFTKYSTSLKHLKPIRRRKDPGSLIMPLDKAGFFSFMTFSWMWKFIKIAYERGLEPNDLPVCSQLDSCEYNSQRFAHLWLEELRCQGRQKASLGRVMWRFCRTRVLITMGIFLLSLTLGFLGPTIFMRKLLEYAEDPEAHVSDGLIWAILLVICEFGRTFSFALVWGINYRTGIRLRSAVLSVLYQKLVKLPNLGDKSIGEIVNIFSNDGIRIFEVVIYATLIVGGPFVAIIATFYIYILLGPHALFGILTFLIFYPVQYGMSRLTGYLRKLSVKSTDSRVRLMNEVLTSIKLIKMYAWEKIFASNIKGVRKEERGLLEKSAYLQSLSLALAPTIPIISVIVTFLCHTAAGFGLTASQSFSTHWLFSFRQAINYFEYGLLTLAEMGRVTERVKGFSAFTAMCLGQTRATIAYVQVALDTLATIKVSISRMKAFTAFAAMTQGQTRAAIAYFQRSLDALAITKVCHYRIKSVLLMPEMTKNRNLPKMDDLSLSIEYGSFSHQHRSELAKADAIEEALSLSNGRILRTETFLKQINLAVPKGALVGICGPVGSGKSSLLSAILGQLKLDSGEVGVRGSIAYVPQQAWIMNATLKENIIFGEKFDPLTYYRVMQCSGLFHDVEILPARENTEIGERGVNLSGGQKQRVALARAVYANRDIYLLDDIFSALDAHVSKQVFEECIKLELREKTILLVTHHLTFLSQCHKILVMKDGEVLDYGTHEELMQKCDYYRSLQELTVQGDEENHDDCIVEHVKDAVKDTTSAIQDGSPPQKPPRKSVSGRITSDEEKEKGSIPISVYLTYVKYAGGGLLSFFVFAVVALSVLSTAASSWWLSYWIKQGSGSANMTEISGLNVSSSNSTAVRTHPGSISDNPELPFYRNVYGSFIAIILFSSLLRGFLFTKVTLRASNKVHNYLVAKIFRAPTRFFEATPVGRLLNLFSRDMDEIDVRLPYTLEAFLQNIFFIAISILLPVIIFPWFVIILAILTGIFLLVTRYFRAGIRDLKRIENIGRSPIYGHVATTVAGLPSIHAFGKERDFTYKFMVLQDENSNCFFLYNCALRWLAVRLDMITVGILASNAAMVLAFHGQTDAAYAGLVLAYAAQLGGMLQYTVRLAAETESRFTSFQRLYNTEKTMESEGNTIAEKVPPKNWPNSGEVEFIEVRLRYRANLPLALNRVSFKIRCNEKVGIVGRTGSGKSTLISALFRLVEIEAGSIRIDGINIKDVGLEVLRSHLAVIPQDPVLFIGTIRNNLDPFGQHDDNELWMTLEMTSMKEKVESLSHGLDSIVSEDGQNFSVGERQLLCMARALLRKSKIIVLDEATASIDAQTDVIIQETLRKAFIDCTLLTIAHRLDTVKACDKIMVMEEGKVVEFDSPSVLLNKPNSSFYKLSAAFNSQMF
ncbi:ATP-binding cassette sub-family C member 5-like isoform X3 [Artemia franciscana]|uniref:ATP-binding cassette sub-family C member 5-like isoform X3 n=1 Tax=Artemia franciscana TaxID=6661 RepID=UPI0032DA47E8